MDRMMFLALAPVLVALATGCGLAVVRGPEARVLEQAREIHVAAGHTCVTDGKVVRCDADGASPLLISSGENAIGFATYADTRKTMGRSCAELAVVMPGVHVPEGDKADCAPTTDGTDRLLIVGFLSIPEGGLRDADFERSVSSFMQGAKGYVEALKAQPSAR